MIEGIKVIGEYIIKKEKKDINNPLDILVGNPTNKDTKNILFIILEKMDENFIYKEIDIEEYSNDKLNKYLYKKGSSKGTDITPISMVTTIESTFLNTKILPWFDKYIKFSDDKDINFLVGIGNCLRENKDEIFKDLKNNYNKENNIISIKIDNKYLGEYEIFKKILIEESKRGFYFTKSFAKGNNISKSNGTEICSICKKEQSEVYGFVGTYKFYTVDKPGFVSGGFQQKDAWKNYPVCLNCALKLEAGKKYLKSKLDFNFYGFKYHLIPKSITSFENKEDLFDLIEEWKYPKFIKGEINRLTQDENEILELMSKQENYLNMNFMFYDTPKGYDGSVFNILLYIEDILPSRLRKLFDVKREVDKINIFEECLIPVFENKKKIGEKSLEFNFGIVRTFFRRISDNRTYNKYFLEVVNKIFTNKFIAFNFLLHLILGKIRDEFVNNYQTEVSTLKGFILLNYLNKLGILGDFKEVKKMNEEKNKIFDVSGEINKKINNFFSEFTAFFNSNDKKAIFLEGVLAQKLLNIQRLPDVSNAQPGKEPFRHRLKGLKLNEKLVRKLLSEIQNKLEEYGKNYYTKLESLVSGYFVSAGNDWKLTTDEISFYFVLGMNLSYLFKKEENKKEEDKNE